MESCVLLWSIRVVEVVWDILLMLRVFLVVFGIVRGVCVFIYVYVFSFVIFLVFVVNWKECLWNFFVVMEV